MANERVLLVDDEEEFTELLAERMRAREMDLDTAKSRAEAIARVQKKYYDAIILDMQMPGMDGIETLQQILSANPDQQVIFLTGHATVPKSVEAIKMEAVDFLEKPVDIDQLMGMIKEAQVKKIDLFEERMKKSIEGIQRSKGW